MKKFIIGVLVVLGIIGMFTLMNGVNITPKTEQPKKEYTYSREKEPEETTRRTTTETTATPVTAKEQKKQDVFIDFKSAALATDYKGDDILVVTYSFMHRKEKPIAFSLAASDTAYQNGVECDSTVISDYVDTQTQLDKVQPGVRYDVVVGYHLKDRTSDVKIEIYPYLNLADEEAIYKTTIKLT